jgi:hypothetical protein
LRLGDEAAASEIRRHRSAFSRASASMSSNPAANRRRVHRVVRLHRHGCIRARRHSYVNRRHSYVNRRHSYVCGVSRARHGLDAAGGLRPRKVRDEAGAVGRRRRGARNRSNLRGTNRRSRVHVPPAARQDRPARPRQRVLRAVVQPKGHMVRGRHGGRRRGEERVEPGAVIKGGRAVLRAARHRVRRQARPVSGVLRAVARDEPTRAVGVRGPRVVLVRSPRETPKFFTRPRTGGGGSRRRTPSTPTRPSLPTIYYATHSSPRV